MLKTYIVILHNIYDQRCVGYYFFLSWRTWKSFQGICEKNTRWNKRVGWNVFTWRWFKLSGHLQYWSLVCLERSIRAHVKSFHLIVLSKSTSHCSEGYYYEMLPATGWCHLATFTEMSCWYEWTESRTCDGWPAQYRGHSFATKQRATKNTLGWYSLDTIS